jgi:molecular chaperone GrpE
VTHRKTHSRTQEERAALEAGETPQEQVGAPSDNVSQGAPSAIPYEEETGGLDVRARLAQAEAKRDEYLALAQRVQADFENYRKRAIRDQERLVAHAHERLVRELLPILDDLGRALQAAERHEEAALVDGVRLVEQALRKALEKEGVVEIDTNGTFDPHVHEALMAQPAEGVEAGSVLEVVQRGYRMGDKIVRPARVIVAE